MEKSSLQSLIEAIKDEAISSVTSVVGKPLAVHAREDFSSFVADVLDTTQDDTKEARQLIADLAAAAMAVRKAVFGDKVIVTTRVEFSNFCRNDCYFCGKSQTLRNVTRFRLTEQETMAACRAAADVGYRRFLLHSGEDTFYEDDTICRMVTDIKRDMPGSDVALAIGERSRASYRRFYVAGADGYLLPHITADRQHFSKLHPTHMRLSDRMACHQDLRDIGYRVATSINVGLPYQTPETLIQDLIYISSFQPDMVCVVPFVPAPKTFFEHNPPGTMKDTHLLTALTRLVVPRAVIPTVTTLTSHDNEYGLLYGANALITQPVWKTRPATYQPHPFTLDLEGDIKASHQVIIDGIKQAGFEPDLG